MGPRWEVNAALTISPERVTIQGILNRKIVAKLFFRNFLLVGSTGLNITIKLTELTPFLILIELLFLSCFR